MNRKKLGSSTISRRRMGSWRYLAGSTAKEKAWLLGVIQNRAGYGAWIAHLAKGLSDKDILLAFDSETDPWARSKLVGQKIHELTVSFRKTYGHTTVRTCSASGKRTPNRSRTAHQG